MTVPIMTLAEATKTQKAVAIVLLYMAIKTNAGFEFEVIKQIVVATDCALLLLCVHRGNIFTPKPSIFSGVPRAS